MQHNTLPETSLSQKDSVIFQPWFSGAELLVSGRVTELVGGFNPSEKILVKLEIFSPHRDEPRNS